WISTGTLLLLIFSMLSRTECIAGDRPKMTESGGRGVRSATTDEFEPLTKGIALTRWEFVSGLSHAAGRLIATSFEGKASILGGTMLNLNGLRVELLAESKAKDPVLVCFQ